MLRLQKVLFVALLLLVSFGTKAQITLTSNPNAQSGIVSLCLEDSDSIIFTASYGGPLDSVVWTISGAQINKSFGLGSKTLKYTGSGNFNVSVSVFHLGSAVSTRSLGVAVYQLPPINFNIPDTICESDPILQLLATPAGGNFSGPGVSNNNLDPDSGPVGDRILTYTVSNGNCTRTATFTIFVKDSPEPNFRANDFPTSQWQGVDTYTICDSTTTPEFRFFHEFPLFDYDSYSLDFGDGSPLVTGVAFPTNFGAGIIHLYPVAGLFPATLVLIKNNGCSTTETINIFIGEQPAVGFSIPGGTINQCIPRNSGFIEICVAVTGVSQNPPETIYTLTSSDGSPDVVFTHPPPDTVCHQFTMGSCGFNLNNFNNAFSLSFTASNPCSQRSVTVEPIYISQPSETGFSTDPSTCVNQLVSIQDTSTIGGVVRNGVCLTNGLTIWDITPNTYTLSPGSFLGNTFGNPNPGNWSSGSSTLNVTFNEPGIYSISQLVANAIECSNDSLTRNFCVDSIPGADLRLNKDTICSGDSVTASFIGDIQSVCQILDLRWRILEPDGFVLGSTGDLDSTQTFIFNKSGVYTIELRAGNVCDTAVAVDSIVVLGIPSVLLPADRTSCNFSSIQFSDTVLSPIIADSLSPITNYQWQILPNNGVNFLNSTNANSAQPEIEFTEDGFFSVILTITNSCGSSSDTMELSILENPELDSIADVILCNGGTFGIRAIATNGLQPYSFQWGNAATGVFAFTDSVFLDNLSQDSSFYVIVTDSLGCSDSLNFNIDVAPTLLVDAGPTQFLCSPDSTQLNAIISGGSPPYSISWFPSAGLSDTSIANPNRIALDSTILYTIQVTDSLGCVIEDTVSLRVYPSTNLIIPGDTTFCLNSGGVSFAASPVGGNWQGTGILANGFFDPAAAGLGIHTVVYSFTDPFGCTYLDSLDISVQAQPNVEFQILGDTSSCSPFLVQLADTTLSNGTWLINNQAVALNNIDSILFTNTSTTRDSIISIRRIVQVGTGCTDSLVKQVLVYPKPVASFSLPFGCSGDSVQVVNNSEVKSPGESYTWQIPNSLQISDPNIAEPFISFPDNQSGTDSIYSILLIVNSPDGCVDSLSQQITVPSRAFADFYIPASICGPLSIVPQDSSVGQGLNYQWDIQPSVGVVISNGNTPNPSLFFPASTNDSVRYFVKLILTDANGCLDSIEKSTVVFPKPQAVFNFNPLDSCGPIQVLFQNTSSSSIPGQTITDLTFAWAFGNGDSSNIEAPNILFSNTGLVDSVYFIELIVTNTLGCTDTLLDSIRVHPSPISQFVPTDSIGCAPFSIIADSITVSHFPQANVNYEWRVLHPITRNLIQTFNGINSLNTSIPNFDDSLIIQLVVSNLFECDNDSSEILFRTVEDPSPFFFMSLDTGCGENLIVSIDSVISIPGIQYNWFIDGVLTSNIAQPIFTLNNSTLVDKEVEIQLTVIVGAAACSRSISDTVLIFPKPQAAFSFPSLCAGDSSQVVNSSLFKGISASYLWLAPNWVSINDSSLSSPTFYFPESQGSVDSIYPISLIITSLDGCIDTLSQNITVSTRPIADFQLPAFGCSPQTINPVDASLGNGLIYQWSVSPTLGVTLSGSNTSTPTISLPVSLNDSVVYSIKLLLNSVAGCSDSIQKSYTVFAKPTANFQFSPRDSCGPLQINFLNTSSSGQTGIPIDSLDFIWELSNGLSFSDTNIQVLFTNTGIVDSVYLIDLITTNPFGCSDTLRDSVVVHPNPIAIFNSIDSLNCAPFLLEGDSMMVSEFPQANSTYTWNVLNHNDRSIISSFTGISSLNYTIQNYEDSVILQLVTSNIYGCVNDTAERIFYTVANPSPIFILNQYQACGDTVLVIVDSSSSQAGVSYEWFVNNTSVSTLPRPNFQLINNSPNDSNFIIRMEISVGNLGCTGIFTDTVLVYGRPVSNWSSNPACFGDSLAFLDISSSNNSLNSWSWDFGDGTTSTLQNPKHLYQNPGRYAVKLLVTDLRFCVDSMIDSVTVYPLPVPDFTMVQNTCGVDTSCVGIPVNFLDQSTIGNLGGNITQLQWDFDRDGIFDATTSNPSHTFTIARTYTIKLVTSSQFGCTDSIEKDIVIVEAPTANYRMDTVSDCGPLNIVFQDSSSGFITSKTWEVYSLDNLGNKVSLHSSTELTGNYSPNVVFQGNFNRDSTFYIEQTVSNCCGTQSFLDSVVMKPDPVGNFVLNKDSLCGNTVNFQLSGFVRGKADSVRLDFGDGQSIAILPDKSSSPYSWNQQQHTYPANDSILTRFYISLTAFNDCGDSTKIDSVDIEPKKVQAFMTTDTLQVCVNNPVTFYDQSSAKTQGVLWCFDYNPSLGTCTGPLGLGDSISHVFTTAGTFFVANFVTGTCDSDTSFIQILVRPSPTVDFNISNSSVCENEIITFTDQSVLDASLTPAYLWDFGDGNTSNIANPSHSYSNFGNYAVCLSVSYGNGCFDEFCDTVFISDIPDIQFSVENTCAGEPLQILDSSLVNNSTIANITWRLEGQGFFFGPPPSLSYSIPGNYQITSIQTSAAGCIDSLTKTFTIFESPQAFYSIIPDTASDSCGSSTAYIIRDSSVSASPLQYNWDFDFANPGTLTSQVQHPGRIVFPDTGNFIISMTVWNADSCFDTRIDTFFVTPNSRVDFSPLNPNACEGEEIQFTDSTVYRLNNSNLLYFWDFGDGNSSTLQNPVHTYTVAGNYIVKLLVQDPFCLDSLSRPVTIYKKPEAIIDPGPFETCSGESLEFASLSPLSFPTGDIIDSLIWFIEGDRTFHVFRDSLVTIEFNDSGTFQLGLILITNNGCRDTTDFLEEIIVYPTPIINSIDVTYINARKFGFSPNVDYAEPDALYHWDFGDGTTLTTGPADTIFHRYEDNLCRIDDAIEKEVSLQVVNSFDGFGECESFETETLEMLGYFLNVPNAFAPNWTGGEDANLFLPKGNQLGSYELKIFDKWGNLVFISNAIDETEGFPLEGWDGRHKDTGEQLPIGAYAWTITASFNDGVGWPVDGCSDNIYESFGTLTLLK